MVNFKKYSVYIVVIVLFSLQTCLANSTQNINVNNNEEISKQQLEQKENTSKYINNGIEQIKENINNIDKKMQNIKTKEEYEIYPAVRLNIDTPIFGLENVVNQRLKISTDISTADVLSGFSIRDVLKNKVIKIPVITFGSVVVVTRDVKIDENMSLDDSNIVALKIMEYINQTKNTNQFLDNQINKTFEGYISKEKISSIQESKNSIAEFKNKMIKEDEKIIKIHLLSQDESEYTKLKDTYIKTEQRIYLLEQKAEDVLMTDKEVEELKLKIEAENKLLTEFEEQINKVYAQMTDNIDITKLLAKTHDELKAQRDSINKYIKSATQKIPVKNVDNVNNTESNEQVQNHQNNVDNEVKKEDKVIYTVTSIGLLEVIDRYMSTLDELIKKYGNISIGVEPKAQIDQAQAEVSAKNDVLGNVVNEPTKEEKNEILNKAFNIYKSIVVTENKFFLDNLNYTLKDTTKKISQITKITSLNVLTEMSYVFLDLPKNLEDMLKSNNNNSVIDTNLLTYNVTKELENLIKVNIKITEMYNKNILKSVS